MARLDSKNEKNTQVSKPRVTFVRVTRAVGVLLVLSFVIWQWQRVADAGHILAKGNPLAWLAASILQFVCLGVAAVRFSLLLRGVGHKSPLTSLYTDLLCTTALNAALLMGVGDLYRVKRTERIVDNLTLSTALIVLDRGIGFAVICAVVALSTLFFGGTTIQLQPSAVFAVLGIGTAILVLLAWLLARKKLKIWVHIRRPFVGLIARPAVGLGALLSSMMLTAIWLTSIVVVARGLGIEAPTSAIVLAAAIVTVATILPISIGGIGVREAGYALLLASHGVSPSSAIALGIAQYALLLPVIVAGAIFGSLRYRRESLE